jgi:23S rRNA (cytosine1962-C5)-methyltransferase
VLNCFSYTGAFSVAAAAHGARSVVSVDSAARAHGRARRNFDLNRLDLGDPRFEFITGDAFATLARLSDRQRAFDLVILDPPTFSKGAKGQTFAALKDYAELVKAAVNVLAPDGVLVACCNAAKLPESDLDRALGRGAAWAGRRLVVTARIGLPSDFPVLPAFTEGAYLKILAARRLE